MARGLCNNTKNCIVTVDWVAGQAAVSRHGRLPGHDTALGRGAEAAGRDTALQDETRPFRLRHGRANVHDTATVRTWARLCTPRCAQLDQVGSFMHLTQFLTQF